MVIETKYKMEQRVWVVDNNPTRSKCPCCSGYHLTPWYEPELSFVREVNAGVDEDGLEITYRVENSSTYYYEDEVFTNKRAAQAECDRRNAESGA